MRQKTLVVNSVEELKEQIPQIISEYDESTYEGGYINLAYCSTKESDVEAALLMLKESFPKLALTGMSEGTSNFYYHRVSFITLNFNFFDSSKAEVIYKIIEQGENAEKEAFDFVKEVRERLKAIENIKAIHLFLSKIDAAAQEFIETLSEGYEEVPIYGVVASSNFPAYKDGVFSLDTDDAVIIGDTTIGRGISICVCYGEKLFAYVDYLFGWEPVGRYLDVGLSTNKKRAVRIDTIDGEKAADIFKKYLGVIAGPHFVYNVGEFPIVVERNGLYMGRTPSSIGENGEVYIAGDIKPGEKIRFSYAERRDILRKTRDAVARMESFGPESLWLIICGNRFAFLQDEYSREINYFSEGRDMAPGLSLGLGEVYRYHGKGGVLNSALVAVGMREGLEGWSFSVIKPAKVEAEKEGVIPLHERLAHFLSAMTGELIEMAKEADAANEAKSRFLSRMSHEIRTPINAILGMDEMIIREAEDPQIIEYAQNIKISGNTLLGLINDILDFSKVEAGKLDIIPVDYDPSSVVNDIIQMVAPRAKAKGIELKFELNSELPSILNGDEIRMKQVVTNLLTNAIKYTEKGSVTLIGDFEYTSEEDINVNITVKDTGIGIKEEDLENLYVAFKRIDERRNRNIEGTGLGLNITQRLLTLMGGELRVKSTYGVGSEFSFTVPQKVVQREPVGNYIETYSKSIYERKKSNEIFVAPTAEVLVVDDTPINLTVFEGLLKRTRVKVSKADSGAMCLELTKKKKYDMVFLDHRMPVMDGIETLKRLKNDPENKNRLTPIISLTANAISGARERYMDAGFDDYLSKPIIAEKLEALMVNYLPEEKVEIIENPEAGSKKKEDAAQIPLWIVNTPGMNVDSGIRHCGSKEAFLDAAETFKNSIENNYAEIKRTFEDEDIKNFTIKVHSLKSSARIIGLKELSQLAAALEAAGDVKDIDQIREETPQLLSMYKEVMDAFLSEDEDEEDENLPLMDEAKLKEAIDSLKEVAATFDFDSIRYIMETVNGFRVPKEHKKLIKDLNKAVTAADWDTINKLLESGGNDG